MTTADEGHRRRPIIEGHNDLLMELALRSEEPNPFQARWRESLQSGGLALQVCPIFVGTENHPEATLRRALDMVRAWHRAIDENDDVYAVLDRGDLDRVAAHDGIGLLLALEGVEPLGSDPAMIEIFWRLGLRMVGLTCNRRNTFADGAAEESDGGLSSLGRALVRRLVGLGAIVDLAHAGPRTFDQLLASTEHLGVCVTHSACRAIHDMPRNITDAQLRALAERDGVLGVMFNPLVVGADATLDSLVDHILHAMDVMGPDKVGMGGDFIRQIVRAGCLPVIPPDALYPDGVHPEAVVPGLPGPEGYQALVQAMAARGIEGDALEDVCWRNWHRFLQRHLPAGG